MKHIDNDAELFVLEYALANTTELFFEKVLNFTDWQEVKTDVFGFDEDFKLEKYVNNQRMPLKKSNEESNVYIPSASTEKLHHLLKNRRIAMKIEVFE